MKVLQLIDSLDVGGAERVAVTYANALASEGVHSHLMFTRSEGVLKGQLNKNVGYVFVQKKKTIDFKALLKARRYVKDHGISIIHAHTTSYFFATLIKLSLPKVKLIWHTHFGNRVTMGRKQNRMLVLCSNFFNQVFTVNQELKQWCQEFLKIKEVEYLPNFVSLISDFNTIQNRDNTIVCVANLKTPKNHMNLLEAFLEFHKHFPDWKLKLVGTDFLDAYSMELKKFVKEKGIEDQVVFMGRQENVSQILRTASIGVLSSDSEGLPMALLEYGAAGLAVVVTAVGHCEEVLSGNGLAVPSNDSEALSNGILHYIRDIEIRQRDASNFANHINKNYSVAAVIPKILQHYKKLDY